MKNLIANFITAFKAEHIKKQRTGIYTLSMLLGLIIPLLVFIVKLLIPGQQMPEGMPEAMPYNHFLDFVKSSLGAYTYFFFPLLIILIVSKITQIDHKNGGWKLMETQPLFRSSIFFSKFSIILIANLLSIISLVIFGCLFAFLLSLTSHLPGAAHLDFPLLDLIRLVTRIFVASLFVTVLQYVISVLIPSFIWSVIIGFSLLFLTMVLQLFQISLVWNPYQILFDVAEKKNGSDLGYWFIFSEYIGMIGSVLIVYIGYHWYKYKKSRYAIFDTTSKRVRMIVLASISGILFFFLIKPNQMAKYNSTVFSGHIESTIPVENACLVDKVIGDTLAVMPIRDGNFHHKFDKKVLLDVYELRIDNKIKSDVFFSENDSIFASIRFFNKNYEFVFKGTRLAENQSKKADQNWSLASYYLQNNQKLENVEAFSYMIYKEWNDKVKKKIKFKSVDNYIPKTDFLDRENKLLAVYYLNIWDEFVKKRSALFPDKKTGEPSEIIKWKSLVTLTDESLLSSKEYFQYVNNQLIKDDHEDIDMNAKYLRAIGGLPEGSFKDKMLFNQLVKSLADASGTSERNIIVAKYNSQLSNTKYQGLINYKNRMMESLSKGKAAPDFEAVNIGDTLISLSGLKGKYVLIDIWATWCGPCKFQSPLFEKMAIKYKKENIHFLALSVDAKKEDWFVEAQTKSKSVLQLHLNDPERFGKNYSLSTIPRFIFIDPAGNLINSEMPFPGDKAFEILLRKELGLADEI